MTPVMASPPDMPEGQGFALKVERLRCGFTQDDLARVLGVNRSRIAAIESQARLSRRSHTRYAIALQEAVHLNGHDFEGHTVDARVVHTYKGEGLTACGLEVVGPCPDCANGERT